MSERQTLSIDLDELFPGETVEIGKSSIIIRPLSLEQIMTLAVQAKGIMNILAEQGVTWKNYNTADSLAKIAYTLLDKFPDVLEELANVAIADLKKLPLEAIVAIIDKVLYVNLKSRDALEKNFSSLTKNLAPMVEKLKDEEETPEQEPEEAPKKVPQKE